MNNDEKNQEITGGLTTGTEARIVAWISGEASAQESAELEVAAAANPAIAAFRLRMEAVRKAAAEAAAPDRQPLRFSEERRSALLQELNSSARATARPEAGNAGVPSVSQIPVLMRRFNLAFAAVFSIALIAGVTWWGEQTHYRAQILVKPRAATTVPFTLKPDDPEPVDAQDPVRKPKPEELAPPNQQDQPAKPTVTDFIQPIEPPRPNIDPTITKVPVDGGGSGTHDVQWELSQLDEAPVAKYQARPVYPSGMRAAGISGEVTVDFVVDPSGKVRNAVAVHSSQREFEQSACYAVARWTFRPGRKGGRAVYVHMQIPIVFSLGTEGGT